MPKAVSLKKAVIDTFSKAFPFFRWFADYSKKKLRKDFIAGFTVAVILIPQVMAYATLAGLPPVYGLYAALFGAAVASLWGSSPQLATGPVAIVSFLVLTTLTPLAEPGSPEFIALAIALAILVGIVQLLMGTFKLGFIMRAIPHSVILGFSSAAALIIAFLQIPNLFGFSIGRHEYVFQTLFDLFANLINAHVLTTAIGISALAIILILKRNRPAFPAGVLLLTVGTAASYLLGFEEMGVAVVGHIPSTIPAPSLPLVGLGELSILFGGALVIALVGFMEAYAIAKTVAAKTKHKVSIDQELVGQGLSNLVSGTFQGYPISGSFSRTAVNYAAGAVTGLSGVFVSLFVLITLMFLTPFLYNLPLAILAAIVIGAVLQLVSTQKFVGAYKVARTDALIAVVTFAFAFILKPDDAVLIGVVIALALFLNRMIRARVRELGVDTEWQILKTVAGPDRVKTYSHVIIARVEMSLFYANAEFVVQKLHALLKKREQQDGHVSMLVLDFSGVNYMDMTGEEALEEYLVELKHKKIDVYLMYVHKVARGVLTRAHAFSHIELIHNIKELREQIKEHKEKDRAKRQPKLIEHDAV